MHIKEIWNKLIILPKKASKSDHIGDVVESPLWYEWYGSIFVNYEKFSKSNTFSDPFEPSLLPPGG